MTCSGLFGYSWVIALRANRAKPDARSRVSIGGSPARPDRGAMNEARRQAAAARRGIKSKSGAMWGAVIHDISGLSRLVGLIGTSPLGGLAARFYREAVLSAAA